MFGCEAPGIKGFGLGAYKVQRFGPWVLGPLILRLLDPEKMS